MLPALAVVYEPDSFALFTLAQEASGRWRNVWVVDTDSAPPPAGSRRLLERLGTVVDITGLGPAAAAAAVGACGVAGIVSFADSQLVRAAQLAEALGLRHNTPATVTRLTNKLAQRAALRDAGLPVPRFLALTVGRVPGHPGPDRPAAADLFFPAVLKPQVGNGGRDTYPIADAAQLDAVLDALSARGEPMDLILEELLTDRTPARRQVVGDYVSVETLVADGVAHTVMVTGRMPLAEPFRESGAFVPSNLPGPEQDTLAQVAEAAAAALGVTCGCLHTEIKLTPDGPRIIEVNGRIGGGGLPEMLALATGFPIVRATCETALGSWAPPPGGRLAATRVGYQFALQPPASARRLDGLDGAAELPALPGVERVTVNRAVGEALDWTDGAYGYILMMLGTAPDHDTMLRRYAAMGGAAQFS